MNSRDSLASSSMSLPKVTLPTLMDVSS
jgi:hypothetical protein